MSAPPPDLDDILDSVLDEYEQNESSSNQQVEPSSAAVTTVVNPSSSAPTQPSASDASWPASEADILKDPAKFANELKSWMEELSRAGPPSGMPSQDAEPMMKSIEQLIQGLQNLPAGDDPAFAAAIAAATSAAPSAPSSSSSTLTSSSQPAAATAAASAAPAAPINSFDAALDQMMQAVSDGAKNTKNPAAASANPFGDIDLAKMDEMMKTLFSGMGDPSQLGAGGVPPNMDQMMAEMMQQMNSFLNKTVMKEPIGAVTAKYPGWLEANKGKISGSDLAMYEKQFECFQRLAAELDKPGDDMGPVMALMQEMQAYGNPPQEILDELMPGMPPMGGNLPGASGSASGVNPFAGLGGGFPGPGMQGFDPSQLPPLPPELADMDPKKLQELQDACKTQ